MIGVEIDQATGAKVFTAGTEHEALEDLHRLGCTDGLPVVVPTIERVERMILAGGLGAEMSLGSLGPLDGNATVHATAVCAVMAGCLPDYFPVVLAAARALCDPMLDISEVQMTTHSAGPMVIVNGPARFDLGPFDSGIGALGPGNRANATVGRAVRLCMLNIGGGRPGVGDMALLGHAGKFTFCLAEAQESSPYPPLHARLGYSLDQSTVTLVSVESPHSVVCTPTDDVSESSNRLLRQISLAVGNPAANNGAFGCGEVVVLLNPEHADVLNQAGLTIDDIREQVSGLTHKPRATIDARAHEPGEDPDELIGLPPDQILVIVAGGGGIYSMAAPSWGYGVHRNRHVTAEITYGSACEVPQSPPSASRGSLPSRAAPAWLPTS